MYRPANHRDVGEALGLWSATPAVAEGRLFRGGRIEPLMEASDLGLPGTVVNLRRGPDLALPGVTNLHVPRDDTMDVYETARPRVRRWIDRALHAIVDAPAWPVYLHCTAGRDRTGVVVAAALRLLAVPDDVVVGEFLLSDGAREPWIRAALAGFGDHAWCTVPADRLAYALKP